MANLYLDKAGLQFLLNKLNAKYEGMFLGLHAEADVAKKVANKLTLNVGGVANEFDGSGATSVDVAAFEHTHKVEDISDFKTEVRKEIFGATAGDGTVDIHKHTNISELELIAAGDVGKWNAKVGVNDVARLAYTNGNMSGVANVQQALDVLAKNVVLAVGAMSDASENMKSLETAIANEKSRAEGIEGGFKTRIEALEEANAEGGEVAEAIADAQKAADDAQAAIDILKGGANQEGSVAKAVKDAVDAQAATQLEKDNAQDDAIEAAQEQANKGVADAAAEAQRATGEEAKIRQELADEAAEIRGEMATEAARVNQKIADDVKAEADRAKEVEEDFEERIAANEAFVAAQPAIDAEQDRRLTVLEGKFDGEQSVDAKIAAAQAAAEAEAARLDGVDRAAQLEKDNAQDDRIKALEDDAPVKQAAIEKAQSDADSANEKIDAFLDANAVKDDTINTLKEIQLYIEEHGTEAAGMVADIAKAQKAADDEAARAKAEEAKIREDFDAADTALHTAISAEIDADVKVVADALADEKDATKDGSLAKQIADEAARADAEEKDIRADFAAADAQVLVDAATDAASKVAVEKGRAEGAEQALAARIAAFEGEGEGSVKAQVEAVQDALDAFEEAQATKEAAQDKAIEDAQAAADKVAEDLATEAERAAAAEGALADRALALEGLVGKEAAEGQEATGLVKDVADNAAAIAALQAKDVQIDAKDEEQDGNIATLQGDMTQAQADIEANAQAIAANTQALAAIGAPMDEDDINEVIGAVFQ